MTLGRAEALTIRDATPADRAALLDLWVDAWHAARPDIDFAARRPWFDRRLNDLVAQGTRILVGVDASGEPLGFVTVDLVSGEMDQLVTAVAAQRCGVGGALLQHAKRQAPDGLTLTVNQFNRAALRLYERAGFVRVGEGVSTGSGLPVWHMRWPGDATSTAPPGHS